MKHLLYYGLIGIVMLSSSSFWGCTKRPVYRTNPTPFPDRQEVPAPPPQVEETPPPVVLPEPEPPVRPTVEEPPVLTETPPPPPPQPEPPSANILEDFENMAEWSFRRYPDPVSGSVESYTLEVHDGMASGRLNYNFTNLPYGEIGAAYMAANKIIPLDAEELSLWVYGNGSNHWLRIRFIDAKGIKYVADFARRVDWLNQWKKCTISINEITSFDDSQKNLRPQLPLTTEFIYLVCEKEGKRDQGYLLFDNFMTR
ncbi:MAG: hypothetical protein D6675_05600 [Gemmatimonadetes bacterium]|nr:MAG: hypothetical protein D6675_05600 [Gemmatimonadota bacterium]